MGLVSKLLPGEGGFIRTPDGREIYFHEHAIRGATPAEMAVGARVEYAEEPGDEGPNAAFVKPIASAPRRRAPVHGPKEVRARRRAAR
jgi:cold shock CspA family protein